MDRTLILVKPDAFARGLTGEIITRFERKGLKLAAMKLMTVDADTAKRHYADHAGKPFFEGLIAFITSGPMVALIVEGTNAVEAGRQIIGATDPLLAAPGSLRADLATEMRYNLVHGADTAESAEREIEIYFGDAEAIPRRR